MASPMPGKAGDQAAVLQAKMGSCLTSTVWNGGNTGRVERWGLLGLCNTYYVACAASIPESGLPGCPFTKSPDTAINAVGIGIFKSGIHGQQFFRTLVAADELGCPCLDQSLKAYACNTHSLPWLLILPLPYIFRELLSFYKTTHCTTFLANEEVKYDLKSSLPQGFKSCFP